MSDPLPAARQIDWSFAGIPGGVPNRTTIYTTLSPTGGNDDDEIQAAVDAAGVDEVVKLTDGTFNISEPLRLFNAGAINRTGHVVLRGNGVGTILSANIANNIIQVEGPFWSWGTNTAISSGYTKGSTAIVVAAIPASLVAGNHIKIRQDNDPAVPVSGNAGPWAVGQWVKITSIAGTTINFSPPLFQPYSAGLNPQFRFPVNGGAGNGAVNFTESVGIEDLTIRNLHGSAGANVFFTMASRCWLKNVRSENAAVAHINVYDACQLEIRRCYLHKIIAPITSSRGYGVTFGTPDQTDGPSMASSCLFEDNIVFESRGGCVIGYGSSGNVIAYNLFEKPYDTQSPTIMKMDVSIHSDHPMMNLVEGNVGSKFDADFEGGTGGYQVIHRNWWRGRSSDPLHTTSLSSINIVKQHRKYSVLGNILGYPALAAEVAAMGVPGTSVYEEVAPAVATYGNSYKAFMLRYAGEGGDTTGADTELEHDLLRKGNYNYVDGTVPAGESLGADTLADSYHDSAKPDWWPEGMAWPSISPDSPTGATNPAYLRFMEAPTLITPPVETADEVVGGTWDTDEGTVSGSPTPTLTITIHECSTP